MPLRHVLALPMSTVLVLPLLGATVAPTPTRAGIDPCKLLTKQQVSTVLPDHDGGEVAHAGKSMIAGVDAYQCSYLNRQGGLLTVIVNVAVDDKRFAAIKPSFSLTNTQKVTVGEAGWLRGEPNDMKLTAIKGRSVLDLKLLAPGAESKSEALITLAQAAIAHL